MAMQVNDAAESVHGLARSDAGRAVGSAAGSVLGGDPAKLVASGATVTQSVAQAVDQTDAGRKAEYARSKRVYARSSARRSEAIEALHRENIQKGDTLTEEQQATIKAAQHNNTVRATIKGQTDRRWEVWGPVAKGSGANVRQGKIIFKVDSKHTSFYSDKVMSYPQLIVWALEMRRMMDVSVPEGVIRRLEETWVAQSVAGLPENFEQAVISWRKQLQESLQTERKMAAEGWKALQRKIEIELS
jgi:hypothetical protein